MRRSILILLLLVAPAVVAHAEVSPPRESSAPSPRPANPKPSTSGPRGKTPISGQISIADRAPDFVLDASTNRSIKLSSLRGKWMMLVFGDRYRDVAALDSIVGSVAHVRAELVAVCHEKQQTLMTHASRDHVHMLMLADPTGEVAAVYGLYDWKEGETQPGFFVLDPDGIVRLAVLGRIFPADDMFALLRYATGDWESSEREH